MSSQQKQKQQQQPSPSPEAVVGMLGEMVGADLIAALQEAFLTGDFGGVVHVLGTSTNAQVRAGKQAAFDAACTAGDAGGVGLALACGGVRTSAAPGQRSVLCRAVEQGQTDVVRVLAESGQVDVNHAGAGGATALWEAAYGGDVECLRLLLAIDGINVNQAKSMLQSTGTTPLFVACQQGHETCVRLLLAAAGTDQNQARDTGCTPLAMACQQGHEACVRLLLAAEGTKANAPRKGGVTPLHRACRKEGNPAVAALVLVGGGDRFAQTTKHGNTPLQKTTSKAIRELFRLGVDYWQRRRHTQHAHAMRQAVLALLLTRQRLDACALPAPAAPARGRATRASRQRQQPPRALLVHLPEEIWLLFCTFLRSADFGP